ncbi:hypothetical protein GYA49_04935 [Candidatus Beckwithbacteria bacterium]|nr:hypothetical protein [Candidatus Beckwithbacteria bacterium]
MKGSAKPATSKKKTKKETVKVVPEVVASEKPTPKPINNTYIVIALVVVVLLGAGLMLKNQLIVATVNGQAITRWTLISELEKQGGKQTLESLVTKSLIAQEAVKENITVSEDEVNVELAKIEKSVADSGQNFEELLTAQGLSRADLAEQIRIQKLLEKLAGKDVKITDAEVDKYMTDNADSLPESTEPAKLRAQIKESLLQDKISQAVQAWLESVKEKADVKYFLNL